jgi:hypothetical protein
VYGEKLDLIVRQCPVCKKFVAMRVDREDLARHEKGGIFVQDAFVDRSGKPYLNPAERETLLTVCESCWNLLCPDPATHFYH